MIHSQSKSSIIGIAIIGVLVVVAAVIFRQQFDYNPAVKALLKASVAARPDADSLGLDSSSVDSSAAQNFPVPENKKSEVEKTESIIRLVAPFEPMSALESFNADTLSEKINGKAELYLPSGFKNLTCQRL
ncbi:MAG: hypothetical protein HQK65_08315, partial [Desulfamplus sp.]|nr:hypothetical protein [Desulfamplus sp.]